VPFKQGAKFVNFSKQHIFRGRSGFTLIELMVVVAMIGIVAAFAISGLSTLIPRHQVKASAQQIRADLQQAKMEAVRENRNSLVTFTTASGDNPGIFIACFDENDDGACHEDDDTIIAKIDLTDYRGASLGTASFGGATHFWFNSRGLPMDSNDQLVDGAVEVNLKNDPGYSFSIDLGKTGRISIE